ncbi:MAG TPA: helix-turn-helix domain-containing protein [Umezawaea sp.]|nr:helix-turn-helix domain-containing protein [Umezawaea sp.]
MKWLTIQDAADYARESKDSIYDAAADGSLHSHQRVPRGKRRLAEAAVDAWIRGEDEQAQQRACGCVTSHLRPVRTG